jgi:hypothetical protein
MSSYSKKLLSASSSGTPIKVAATSIGSGTLIHTAVAGSTSFDEVYLWCSNGDAANDHFLTVGWGGTTNPDHLICPNVRIPAGSGPIPVVMGLLLNGGLLIKASAEVANDLILTGYVNAIAP